LESQVKSDLETEGNEKHNLPIIHVRYFLPANSPPSRTVIEMYKIIVLCNYLLKAASIRIST
jgi:hypothetical protein